MKNRTATSVITALSHDGRGITHVDGKTIFVDGALVGEEITFEILKTRSRYDEAKIVDVLRPSIQRQTPQCESFGVCGGCSLQHIDSATQLDHKLKVLLEQLEHIGGIKSVAILPAIVAPAWGYRRKARLGVRYVIKKEKLLIGFREKNGRYLADVSSCPVLDNSIGNNLEQLREFILTLDGYLDIPQLEIAVGDSATAIIVRHLKPLTENDLTKLIDFGARTGFHLYLQAGGVDTVKCLVPFDSDNRLTYHLPNYDLTMRFHPTDFIQINSKINEQLIRLALELLAPQPHETFLDLFCGIGNFTLPLARYCQQVTGIEGSDLMVQRAYENAAHNGVQNVKFAALNLQDDHYNTNYDWHKVDGVIIDPPRTGALEIIKLMPQMQPQRVVYISCNPATFARDAGCLSQRGYSLLKVGVLDMFPHTSHVESIGLFVKK